MTTPSTPDWPDPARGAKRRQLIGIARRQLGIADDAHQARVRLITKGRTSTTTECTLVELDAILDAYKACGFVPAPAPGAGRRRVHATPHAATPSGAQDPAPVVAPPAAAWQSPTGMRAKIGALLNALNDFADASERKGWGYAAGILRRQKGLPPGVAAPLELASADELRGVIAALDRQLKRERAKAGQVA